MKEIITKSTSVQIYIIYVPSQQLQDQLQKRPCVDTVNSITESQFK
jgi:hypothetical protein